LGIVDPSRAPVGAPKSPTKHDQFLLRFGGRLGPGGGGGGVGGGRRRRTGSPVGLGLGAGFLGSARGGALRVVT
jgi:hypothetical protein